MRSGGGGGGPRHELDRIYRGRGYTSRRVGGLASAALETAVLLL